MVFGLGSTSKRGARGTAFTTPTTTTTTHTRRHHGFHLRKDPDRVAGGYSTHPAYDHSSAVGSSMFQRLLWPTPTQLTRAVSTPSGSSAGWYVASHRLHVGRLADRPFKGRGNEAHVPLMTKIKRTLGIRSTPRTHTVSSTSRTRRTQRARY